MAPCPFVSVASSIVPAAVAQATVLTTSQRTINRQILLRPGIHAPGDKCAAVLHTLPTGMHAPSGHVPTLREPSAPTSAPEQPALQSTKQEEMQIAASPLGRNKLPIAPTPAQQVRGGMELDREATSGRGALTEEELWKACCALQPDFAYAYVAYHHFRGKVGPPACSGGRALSAAMLPAGSTSIICSASDSVFPSLCSVLKVYSTESASCPALTAAANVYQPCSLGKGPGTC